jgi:hypothetical protein
LLVVAQKQVFTWMVAEEAVKTLIAWIIMAPSDLAESINAFGTRGLAVLLV